MSQYETLSHLSQRASMLDGISQLLSWDQETYMPEHAAPIRAEQRKLLAELSHTIKTGQDFERALTSLIDLESGTFKEKELDELQKASLRAHRHDFVREKKLPTAFVEEFTLTTSQAIPLWQQAKQNNDFASFAPTLDHIVRLVQKKAEYIGYKEHPYDALIDEYEPGFTTQNISSIFSELKAFITPFIKKIPPQEPLELPATKEEQVHVCKELLEHIGFDFRCGRMDLSAHPFSCSYHPYDSRLTTREEADGVITQVLTALHEAGHSFYDMGRKVEHQGTPLGQPISHGIHESQSRFWETRIGRSRAFWHFFLPKLKELIPNVLSGETFEQFYLKLNRVHPSLIRTDADEVTYPLHVILRFEIEKELLTGALKTKELPERWASGMKELLGIVPPNDRLGCLQDIHWSMGAFGYFPTYSLGNLYAAQLFDLFAKELPNWEQRVAAGQFSFIKEWLYKTVWQHGRRFDGQELMQHLSKKALTATPFITYLKEKYSSSASGCNI